MSLLLYWLSAIFIWPGTTFMDWLARTFPYIVIRYDIGFSAESYALWSVIVASLAWGFVAAGGLILLRRRRHRRS